MDVGSAKTTMGFQGRICGLDRPSRVSGHRSPVRPLAKGVEVDLRTTNDFRCSDGYSGGVFHHWPLVHQEWSWGGCVLHPGIHLPLDERPGLPPPRHRQVKGATKCGIGLMTPYPWMYCSARY